MPLLLNRADCVDPPLMASAFKFGVQPGIDDHFCQIQTDHPRAKSQNISIIMLP